jgi:Predicted integral membrane protein (DUF2269)
MSFADATGSPSFSQHLVLWLHVAFVAFTIGPVTLAIMSTPRYIRLRDVRIVRYLSRITLIFTTGSLGVLIAGLFLAQMLKVSGKSWVVISTTLFAVAVVLLVLIARDQRRAIKALTSASPDGQDGEPTDNHQADDHQPADSNPPDADQDKVRLPHVATAERARIAMTGGLVSIIWLVILVLMVWNS